METCILGIVPEAASDSFAAEYSWGIHRRDGCAMTSIALSSGFHSQWGTTAINSLSASLGFHDHDWFLDTQSKTHHDLMARVW
jgi:hypothetical protein